MIYRGIPACFIIRHLAGIPIAADPAAFQAVIELGDVGLGVILYTYL
jgi:hypothetical protein